MDRKGKALLLPLAFLLGAVLLELALLRPARGGEQDVVPQDQRGRLDAERSGTHDASNIRTVFWNYGMVGDYPADPGNVDLSVFHSVEVPKGSGMNYSDGITPFVLAKIEQVGGIESYIMETGYRERQALSPYHNRIMRFEPRPGYFQPDPNINHGRSPAISSDPRTWPDFWPDKANDPDDPGWPGSWNGYFGKKIVADQESYMVMDDDYYDAWNYYPDSRDSTRHGLGLRIEVRGFQWSNPQARNVIFWHYDITNEGTTDYDDNIIFGLYMDSGVGGSALSCDGIYESDDDNAYFDRTFNQDVINLVYTWDRYGHGRDLAGSCSNTGYLGYAYLETPGNALDGIDNDEDGITDERRDSGPGQLITGQQAIQDYVNANYDLTRFERKFGPLENLPAYRAGRWWTGDEDMDWTADLQDVGADGLENTGDTGEGDGIPTEGEPNFDRTDLNESDQIGLTGFKINRIKPGQGNPDPAVDAIVFYTDSANWPQRLYQKFSDPDPAARFDPPLAANYNIGFLFASGPFQLKAGQTERFSLALAYGADLNELRNTVKTVQQIYDANYRFAVPPKTPTVTAETGDGFVRLSWDAVAEKSADPVTGELDFEGYRIYRATDPDFRDSKVITTGTGSGPIGNGRPMAQFDLKNGITGFSTQVVEGVAYYLGNDGGITHTWLDTTATNGQLYYYAVCAYDHGSEAFDFYPSENAINVSRTPRGGLVLASNAVAVRPNPKASGFVAAGTGDVEHTAGQGIGQVSVEVVNSSIVPDHLFKITFATPSPESLLARSFSLVDSTTHATVIGAGVLDSRGDGPVGSGLLPVISTQKQVEIDEPNTKWRDGSPTNAQLQVSYLQVLPRNQKRPGFPDDITVTFSDQVVDTSLAIFPIPAVPAKLRIVAHGAAGDLPLDFRFRDLDGDGTLSRTDEYVDAITYPAGDPGSPKVTWRFQLDPATTDGGAVRPPTAGDVFDLALTLPLGVEDMYLFQASGEMIDPALARSQFEEEPYVVPNPYVGSASFEPERYNINGRGERRLEFRGLPRRCTIRIYNVHGDLVQTLQHDGGTEGYEAWNLRTKDNLDVAPGLYIFHVDGGKLGKHIGKFAVIK